MAKWRPPKMPDPNKPTIERKTYAMYPEDIRKLIEIAKKLDMSASSVLRELINVAYVERILQKKETPCYYALNSPNAGQEPKKW